MTLQGPITGRNGLVLLGGGVLFERLGRALPELVPTVMVTSPRHQEEHPIPDAQVLEKVSDFPTLDVYSDFGAESLAISIGAAWVFTEQTIRGVFCDRLFNVHGARLPVNRGAGGFSWHILMGTNLGGCTFHKIDAGVDIGPIYAADEFVFPANCRLPRDFIAFYEDRAFDFLYRTVQRVVDGGRFDPMPQQHHLSTYWPRLNTPLNGWIDWSWSVGDLDRFVRAFDDPYPGARTLWQDEEVVLRSVRPELGEGQFHPFQHGLVFRMGDSWLLIAADGGALLVEDVCAPDGQSLMGRMQVGDRLWTPTDRLDAARVRVTYTPKGLKM